jgi:hypothetical protein
LRFGELKVGACGLGIKILLFTVMSSITIHSVSKETRRRLLWQLFQQLIQGYSEFFGHNKCIFTYDCAELLYCTQHLGLAVGSPAREFLLTHDPVSSPNLGNPEALGDRENLLF